MPGTTTAYFDMAEHQMLDRFARHGTEQRAVCPDLPDTDVLAGFTFGISTDQIDTARGLETRGLLSVEIPGGHALPAIQVRLTETGTKEVAERMSPRQMAEQEKI